MPRAKPTTRTWPSTARYCPRCFRVDEEIGSCANFALGCPEPEPADPTKVVTVSCGPCGKVRTIPIQNIMQRKFLTELGPCSLDKCAAQVVSSPSAPSPLPPLGG